MSPRDFLQKIFPTVNPNVLELVFQGCGGNLERTIEQLASSSSVSNVHASQLAQHAVLQQRLASGKMGSVPPGVPVVGQVPPLAS